MMTGKKMKDLVLRVCFILILRVFEHSGWNFDIEADEHEEFSDSDKGQKLEQKKDKEEVKVEKGESSQSSDSSSDSSVSRPTPAPDLLRIESLEKLRVGNLDDEAK